MSAVNPGRPSVPDECHVASCHQSHIHRGTALTIESRQSDIAGMYRKQGAADMRYPKVVTVNKEAIRVRVRPAHRELNGVMQVLDLTVRT